METRSHLTAPLTTRDAHALATEIESLRQDVELRHAGFSAKTIADDAEIRTMLCVMRSGHRIRANRHGTAWLRVLAGHLELHLGDVYDMLPYEVRHTEGACSFFALYDHSIDLSVGSLLVLDPGVPRDVEALDDSAFLLDVESVTPTL
jgi:hypothetical protein